MQTLFKKQLETNKPVTEKLLSELKIKKYHSGENIKVGDIVLYAMLNNGLNKNNIYNLELATLNKNQFDLYCVDEKITNTELPTIKLK